MLAFWKNLGTTAIFKNDRLIGFTSKNESQGINIINGKINEIRIKNNCPNNEGFIITELNNIKNNISIIFKNNKPIVNIDVKSNGSIVELYCDIDITKSNNIKTIENETKENLNQLINIAINTAKYKYQSDIFGFGNLVYKKNPHFFKNIENWDNYFKDIELSINIDLKINTKGSLQISLEAYNER